MKETKSARVSRATKRAYASAARAGEPVTWQQAKRLGVLWCAKMWPLEFEEHPWIEWRGSRHFLKAAA